LIGNLLVQIINLPVNNFDNYPPLFTGVLVV